ncbi:hypothetical protein ABK040_001301 [Willaertia magna]
MKRKDIVFIHDKNNIPIEKKVKICHEIEQSLQNIYQTSKECNSVMTFTDYTNYIYCFLKFRNSELFKNLSIDILLQINNYLQVKDKITMIYVCKNWFEIFNNSDYFWNNLSSLLQIENKKHFEINQIRNFILLKLKYFKEYEEKERRIISCSADYSYLEYLTDRTISLNITDNIYYKGTFNYYNCQQRDGYTYNYETDLQGVYFEPTTLQCITLYLKINIYYATYGADNGGDNKFSFFVFRHHGNDNESDEEALEIVEMKRVGNDDFVIDKEALRTLVREYLKLSEEDVPNELDWLKEFLEDKIPKEANCKEIFENWPIYTTTINKSEED